MERIGFVGLGDMGGRICKRLLDAGYPVTGYNRTASKAAWLQEAGLRLVGTPRQAAEEADIVFTMVTDTAALHAVTGGPDGVLAGLRPGRIYVDMSSVSPAASRELAERVAALGATMLDCPVSGAPLTVERGEASVMAGGPREAFERVEPVLSAIGRKVIHMGGNGQAVLMKAAVNLSLAVQYTAFSEGLLIAERGGIPRKTAIEALMASVVASPSLKYRAPFAEELPDPAWFDCAMMQKDLMIALETGRGYGVPMPTTAVVNELLTAARAMGYEREDFAALYRVLARNAGLER